MSFTPLMMKLVANLIETLPPSPSVIELGNQTFDPTLGGSLRAPQDMMFPRVIEYLRTRHPNADEAALRRLMALTHHEQNPHTASYYRGLGFKRYESIDVNARYGSMIMDLNVDLREAYGFSQTFDLCTNNGTGEHVFNQATVFRNMHQLTRPGGVMLFVLPFYNWMNHGFFNFNPLLFTDLAAANRYEVVRLSVGCPVGQEIPCREGVLNDNPMRLPWQPADGALTLADFQSRGSIKPRTARNQLSQVLRRLTGRPTERQASRLNQVVEKLAERSANINIIAALRKTADTPFVFPLQGMYAGQNVETPGLRARYGVA